MSHSGSASFVLDSPYQVCDVIETEDGGAEAEPAEPVEDEPDYTG